MPKQKQKQKQTQVTKVTVKVGDTVKAKRKSRARRASAPMSASQGRHPPMSSIGITLQGSSLSYPAPPTQQYNELVQQVDALRRELAKSGSLIPRAATNDIFNRVQSTNTIANQMLPQGVNPSVLMRPEGVVEEEVEGLTTQNPFEPNNFSAEVPLDQDWIRNVAVANLAQSFSGITNKIGLMEDPETIADIDEFDRDDQINQNRLAKSVEMDEWITAARERAESRKEKKYKSMAATMEKFSEIGEFTPTPVAKKQYPKTREEKEAAVIKKQKQYLYNKARRERLKQENNK